MPHSQFTSRSMLSDIRGASVEQAQLIRCRFQAGQLKRPNSKQMGALQGQHMSPHKGRGLSFHHVREYQGGDEIRHIDWRVTARTTKAHTKIFEEERERPVIICLDQRRTMAFGSRTRFKSVSACHAAALLAWAGLESSDRIGGIIFQDHQHREIRPRRSQKNVLHFLHQACEANQALLTEQQSDETLALAQHFEALRRITRPGSSVFIISDFHGFDQAAERQLTLLARHNSVTAIQVFDELEAALPQTGNYPISNGKQRLQLRVTREIQTQFSNHFQARTQDLQGSLQRCRISLSQLSTEQEPLRILQQSFKQGMQLS
ncbi:DUF58 domain-containing protein [Spongiibacter sp. KMU-158]|uniref:DUF58 domain-containing protein n=1 Tax=Spongiibacter pelagi TaxID=2760804 RepID=A0A927C212_9GAMM|nr:DUF58 domain-containing protein [Spongiibacter pelagi]MBD2858040.1 DUF58 domain-containing protein [Spongiibacter pelagi]